MKTDLFVWGRPDEGAMVNRLSGFAAGLWTVQGRWKRKGDVRIDLSLSMKKRVMHSENK